MSVLFFTKGVDGVFYWPQKKDRGQIEPKFIFCRNWKVTKDPSKAFYHVKNFVNLQNKFEAFLLKYFSPSVETQPGAHV